MSQRISINLLPQEFTKLQQQQSKYYKLRLVALGSLILMVFLASTTVALRILQSRSLQTAQFSLQAAQTEVSQFKQTEVSLVVLKDRLNNISQINSASVKQSGMYNLINNLVPPSVLIDSVTVDRSGNTTLSLTGSDASVIDDFISSLVDESKNESKVKSLEVGSFSRSRESLYRVNLKIVAN